MDNYVTVSQVVQELCWYLFFNFFRRFFLESIRPVDLDGRCWYCPRVHFMPVQTFSEAVISSNLPLYVPAAQVEIDACHPANIFQVVVDVRIPE